MAKIRREANEPGPFYLDLAFLAPHAVQRETSGLDPIDEKAVGKAHLRHGIRFPVPPPRDAGRFVGEPLPDRPAFDERDVSDKPKNIQARPPFTRPEINEIKKNYRRRLETLPAVDRGVAKIVSALSATKQLDNTVIVFVSDNGFFHGEHRIPYGKYLPYDPSIRVPLIIRGPGFAKNETNSALIENVDLPATILDLAGAKPLRKLDGRSLVPLLENPAAAWPRQPLRARRVRPRAVPTPVTRAAAAPVPLCEYTPTAKQASAIAKRSVRAAKPRRRTQHAIGAGAAGEAAGVPHCFHKGTACP